MAGGGSDEDNPVAVNVVALIDILMCLLLFYMCAAKFAAAEGRMDAFLPMNKGAATSSAPPPPIDEVRVKLTWEGGVTVKRFGARIVERYDELEDLIKKQYDDLMRAKKKEAPDPSVVLEVLADVPTRDVIKVMDVCRKNNINNIEFSFTADAAGILLK